MNENIVVKKTEYWNVILMVKNESVVFASRLYLLKVLLCIKRQKMVFKK